MATQAQYDELYATHRTKMERWNADARNREGQNRELIEQIHAQIPLALTTQAARGWPGFTEEPVCDFDVKGHPGSIALLTQIHGPELAWDQLLHRRSRNFAYESDDPMWFGADSNLYVITHTIFYGSQPGMQPFARHSPDYLRDNEPSEILKALTDLS